MHDREWQITDDFGSMRLLGLSWRKSSWDREDNFIKDWAAKAGEDEFTIVMGHAPDYISDIIDLNIDLALAGHLHGGQLGIPGLQQFVLRAALHAVGSDFPAEWAAGYRKLGKLRINVSAGIGSHGPARALCPPTMTLFKVAPKLSAGGIMKSYQITFGRYQVYHAPIVTKPIPRKEKADISRLRCARPLILFDLAIIGIVVFLYAVQKRIIPVSVAAFFPYVLISFLLARIRTGFGGRYGRCVVFSYLSVFIFFATVAALALVVEVKILQIGALVVAGALLFITNFILLPLNIEHELNG